MDDGLSYISSSDEDDESLSVASLSTLDVSDDCLTTASTTTKKNAGRLVRFATVEVREHSLTLGDHPWANEYPLALDWNHSQPTSYDLDVYEEQHRRSYNSTTRINQPRRLSATERMLRLITVNNISELALQDAEQQRREEKAKEMERLLSSFANISFDKEEEDYMTTVSKPLLSSAPSLPRRSSGIFSNLILE
ncbi:hypothetical protein ACA910_008128 [Epithemia clementina (nom. ined.)]